MLLCWITCQRCVLLSAPLVEDFVSTSLESFLGILADGLLFKADTTCTSLQALPRRSLKSQLELAEMSSNSVVTFRNHVD